MDWKIIKENYSNYLGPYKNLKEEFLWLNNEFYCNERDTDERWNNMSRKEKQLERLYRSKSSKKSAGFKLGIFNYEESILDLVEAINLVLKNLQETKKWILKLQGW